MRGDQGAENGCADCGCNDRHKRGAVSGGLGNSCFRFRIGGLAEPADQCRGTSRMRGGLTAGSLHSMTKASAARLAADAFLLSLFKISVVC